MRDGENLADRIVSGLRSHEQDRRGSIPVRHEALVAQDAAARAKSPRRGLWLVAASAVATGALLHGTFGSGDLENAVATAITDALRELGGLEHSTSNDVASWRHSLVSLSERVGALRSQRSPNPALAALKARLCELRGHHDAAGEAWRGALAHHPEGPIGYAWWWWREARNAIWRLPPGSAPKALHAKVTTARTQAISHLSEVVRRSPGVVSSADRVLLMFLLEGQELGTAEARTALEDPSADDRTKARLWLLLATEGPAQERPEAAREAQRLAPNDAFALLRRIEDTPATSSEAQMLLENGLARWPDQPELLLARAHAALSRADNTTARTLAKKAAERHPDLWPARLCEALALEALGEQAEAAARYEDLARNYPQWDQPLSRLGALWERSGSFEQAWSAWDRAIARHPRPETLRRRGLSKARSGHVVEAQRDLLAALASSEFDRTTRRHVLWEAAACRLASGDHAGARRVLSERGELEKGSWITLLLQETPQDEPSPPPRPNGWPSDDEAPEALLVFGASLLVRGEAGGLTSLTRGWEATRSLGGANQISLHRRLALQFALRRADQTLEQNQTAGSKSQRVLRVRNEIAEFLALPPR